LDKTNSLSQERNIYFPNLNGLRFLAAAAVVVHHTEAFKWIFGLPNVWKTSAFIAILGNLGVVLFFVLSGFLITYLLLEEEGRTGQIRVSRFYLRRALRIWPLYYFFIMLALFVLPYTNLFVLPGYGIEVVHKDFLLKTVLYATLFANVVLANLGIVPYAAHTWSIGTEEQFYLIWPLLMKHVRNKVGLMLTVIVLYVGVRVLMESNIVGTGTWLSWIRRFYAYFNIDCMAIGGLAAVILHKKFRLLALFVNLPVFYVTLITTLVLIARGVTIPSLHYESYAILFAVLILNFSSNSRIGWSMEFEPLHYLGKISYGLYMLHPLAIVASIRLLSSVGWSQDIFLYPACLLTTIGLAAASYHFIESPFLSVKHRFTMVVSGENARASERINVA
jgi:peptidoglycan/LPS O-acetylase OafA/YrhL